MNNQCLHAGEQPISDCPFSELIFQCLWFCFIHGKQNNFKVSTGMKQDMLPPPPFEALIAFTFNWFFLLHHLKSGTRTVHFKKYLAGLKQKLSSEILEGVANATCQILLKIRLAASFVKAFSFLSGGTITWNLFPEVFYEKSRRGQLTCMSILALLVKRKCQM